MKKILPFVFIAGMVAGAAAQTVVNVVRKNVKLDLPAGKRLVCSVSPTSISPASSLVMDYKVPTGKKLGGYLMLSAELK